MRSILACAALTATCWSASAQAATITVNSLLDDVFPDAAGGISVPLTTAKCTLRMAIASANLDLPVGGATFGCPASTTPATSYVTGGADNIVFDAALANGTILLDATQAMNVGAFTNNTGSILVVTGPVAIDGTAATAATRITLDGGLLATNTSKRILAVSEVVASAAESRTGSSIWVSLLNLNFQNARVESAGACVLSFENIRMFDVSFINCVSTNTPTVASGGGGALFVRASDNNALSFRPDVRLTRVSFKGNKALAGGSTSSPGGGAFFLGSGNGRLGHIYLSDVTVGGPNVADRNVADGGYGGGSITRAESVSIATSTFQGNGSQTSEVGGLRVDGTNGTVTITNSSFLDNVAQTRRGGLSITANDGLVVLRGLTVAGNTALQFEGGMTLASNLSVTLSDSSITGNTASGSGGLSVFTHRSAVSIDSVIISGNRALNGSNGGFNVRDNAGALQMRRVGILNNAASKGTSGYASAGGGSFRNNTSVVMTDSAVSGNTSDFHIGAMGLDASFSAHDGATGLPLAVLPPTTNTITLDRVTISGNTTTGAASGGSGYSMNYINSPGLYTFQNSTITGNVVTNGGDPALTFQAFNPSSQVNATRVVIRNSTIARNTGNGSEAASFGAYNNANPSSQNPSNGSLVLESSVLGGRQGSGNPTNLIGAPTGLVATITNTLVENNGDGFSAQCNLAGNLCNVDAKLDPLASNGGPTQTLRLLAGSPAINAGSNVTGQLTDQRGAARPLGAGADMGAYETPAGSAVACNLDMDGDNLLSHSKEGIVLVRAMLGFTGAAVTAGTGLAAPWATIRANLNANCGTSFAP